MAQRSRNDFIAIAKIGRYRGTRGEVFIHPYIDLHVEEIDGKMVRVVPQRGNAFQTKCERIWWHGKKAICSLDCSASIEEARKLVHAEIQMARSDLMPLEADEFFTTDIIGLEVSTIDGRQIGTVERLLSAGGQSTLVIAGENSEILVPFVEEIVVEIDLADGWIRINPPPGLLEINEN